MTLLRYAKNHYSKSWETVYIQKHRDTQETEPLNISCSTSSGAVTTTSPSITAI